MWQGGKGYTGAYIGRCATTSTTATSAIIFYIILYDDEKSSYLESHHVMESHY